MNRAVNLTKRILTNKGLRYCPVVLFYCTVYNALESPRYRKLPRCQTKSQTK